MHSQADGSRQWGVGVQEEASGAGLAVRMVHLGGPDGGGGGLPPSAALWELRGEPAERAAARDGEAALEAAATRLSGTNARPPCPATGRSTSPCRARWADAKRASIYDGRDQLDDATL